MALRQYFSDNLGAVWVVDQIRVTDKIPKKSIHHASMKKEMEYVKQEKKNIVTKKDKHGIINQEGNNGW